MLRYLFIFLTLLLLPSKKSKADESIEENNAQKPMDIYLLIGQSNMAGRAEIELSYRDTLANVYLFTGIKNREWERAANPLNRYSTVRKNIKMQKLGLGYIFARKMATQTTQNRIGLVVNARGGTKIELWAPGTKLYNEAIRQTKKALKDGVLKGIIWHQGGSDVREHTLYMPKILELIKALRRDFGIANLPFVAGQLSKEKSDRKQFNQMILDLPKQIDNCGVVKTKGTSTIDNIHFDAESQRKLGERYARKMLYLLKTITPE